MKHSLHLMAALCALASSFITPVYGETLLISTGEYQPWTSKQLKHGGFVNHVITEAFKQEGIDVSYTYLPWKRAYQNAQEGAAIQATSFWFRSPEREAEFYHSEPVMTESTVFFYRKADPMADWRTLDDLKPYRIGATIGYTYNQAFWDAGKSKQLKLEPTPSDDINLKKLLAGRIDIFPIGLVAARSLLRAKFTPSDLDRLTYNQAPLAETTGHLLLPKKHPNAQRLLGAFNRGLSKLKKKGLYDRFYQDLLEGRYER